MKDLSHAARMGLEAIPDPAAGEALRAALPGLAGAPLIGVINSLAARRETNAVADLGRYLTDPNPQVAAAACAALGNDRVSRRADAAGKCGAPSGAKKSVRNGAVPACAV